MAALVNMRALGKANLPASVTVDGRACRLSMTFKHSFVSAVGLYECGADRVVLKCYRSASFCGIPLAWTGRLMAEHEAAMLRRVQDIRGVPGLRGRHGRTGILRDYVPGEALARSTRVGEDFFPDLFRILGQLHERGVAYVDLEKAENVLLGEDGLPHLIDFQLAFFLSDRWGGGTAVGRFIRAQLQQADLYHARKHSRHLVGEELSEQELARARRKPWVVKLCNLIYAPYMALRRRVFRAD